MGRLEGKVAVVLGAAGEGNMGQVIARRFAREGARCVVAGRQAAPLEVLATEIGGRAATCDITRKAEVESLGQLAVDAYGRVDVAINCTGWGLMAKLLETSEEQIDKLTALQFKGPYFFLQVFCGLMSQSGGGSIITISSASVYALLYNHAAYIGTKAGADALVRCFANEFGSRGVKVNSIAPGLTATPMTERDTSLPGLRGGLPQGVSARAHRHHRGHRQRRALARNRRELRHRPGAAGQRWADAAAQPDTPRDQRLDEGCRKVLIRPRSLAAGVRRQIGGEGAEPVAALVVLAGHGGQAAAACAAAAACSARDAPVARRQPDGDALEHPRAAQVEAVEVRELGVGAVGDDARGEPRRVRRRGMRGRNVSQPAPRTRGRRGTRRMRSASARQGERKSSPEGS